MAGDTEDLILSISADTKQIQRALQRLTGDTQVTTTAIQQQFDQLGNKTAGSFDATATRAKRSFSVIQGGARDSGKAIEASMKASSFQTANLASQLQDIAVQLKGGASPLTIALQQGTQINQVIGQAGAAGAVKALGGAFTSLINPVSLATIATITLIGYAVQYFSSVRSGGEKSAETLKQEAELINQVAQKWGDALPAVKAYADERARALDVANAKQATNLTIAGFFEDAKKEIVDLNAGVAGLYEQIGNTPGQESGVRRIQLAFAGLQSAIDENRDSTKEVKELQEALNAVYQKLPLPDLKRFSDTVDGLAENWKKAAKNADEARKAFVSATEPDVFDPRDPRFQGPTGPLPTNAPTPSERPSFEDVGQTLSSLNSAIDAFTQRVVKAESGGDTNAKNPNSSATGTGQFIESTWLNLFRKYYPAQAQNLSRDAILDLRKNADYSYTLIQAYARENAAVLEKAGVHVDEAALQLAHFLGAGDAAKVLSAASGTPLAGLISQKSIAANPTILGDGRTVDDAIAYANRRASGLDAAQERKRTPDNIFQGKADDVQKRIDALNAEYEAQAKLNPLIKDYGYAAEKAKIEAELLAEAHQAGLEVTPKLAAQISTLAENYAKASASGNQLKDTNTKIVQQQRELNDLGRGVLGGIIDDLKAGKDAGEIFADVLSKIGDKLEELALNALFPTSGIGGLFGGAGGGGGLLGGLLIPGILHSGGVAGVDGYSHGRKVSPATFAGATRYHQGGVAGLRPGEVPAILQKGEIITPKGKSVGGASSVHVTVGVSADNDGNLMPFVESVSERKAGQISSATITQYDKGLAGRISDVMERHG
ncbi:MULTISPECIES: phage tail length tape measure family protein [unclassified Mesorhizobium]|uniref:phage tail length tape measure family protein n=1 Tax=unclassified Mesorhizobium TaxID=325217 RepID=UPI00112A9F34|nr:MULTISPECIES: phage tail length tape measure family protein [unclassified Mesorhizobium]MCA0025469.1 phage tail length tape measure family protein [Mesorhizobium sp. B263B1A]TPJ97142.1 hypothetical protein FJ489_11940 [Mesorhizobium sp. B2-5-12]TPK27191.1 hypothetical protein FJ562_08085 [Mesorhizobium sp. B2-5-6]